MEYVKKYWIIILVVFGLAALFKPALCFLIIGSIIFYFAIAGMRFQKKLSNNGIGCTGRVLSFEVDSDGYKTPVIEFTPIGGTMITEKPFVYATTNLGKLTSSNNLIGDEVQITYDPENPKKFILVEEKGFNVFIFSLFFLIGLVLIAVGIAGLAGYIKLG